MVYGILFNALFNFRKATTEMMCMQCLKIQPVGQNCTTPSCGGFSMAKYYCGICKFFDDERYFLSCSSFAKLFSYLLQLDNLKTTLGFDSVLKMHHIFLSFIYFMLDHAEENYTSHTKVFFICIYNST